MVLLFFVRPVIVKLLLSRWFIEFFKSGFPHSFVLEKVVMGRHARYTKEGF